MLNYKFINYIISIFIEINPYRCIFNDSCCLHGLVISLKKTELMQILEEDVKRIKSLDRGEEDLFNTNAAVSFEEQTSGIKDMGDKS